MLHIHAVIFTVIVAFVTPPSPLLKDKDDETENAQEQPKDQSSDLRLVSCKMCNFELKSSGFFLMGTLLEDAHFKGQIE